MYLRKLSVFTLLLSSSGLAAADIEPIFTVGIEGGGDDLVSTTVTDLKAGGGINFGVGLSFSQPDSARRAHRTRAGYGTPAHDALLHRTGCPG